MNEREKTDLVPKYLMIPEEFGDYDRLDHGHPGGMGVVYKVLNRRLNVERALKVLRPDVADRMPVRDAFIREANFGAQLAAGPYILPVHAVGTLQGWDFIEMDWVEGPNLAEFLRERGKLNPWAALTLGAMVLDALNYAHRAKIRYPDGSTKDGIIHRDIKPANILIDTRTSRPLLTDFGIALAREVAKDRQGGYTAGTINYLPPELVQDRPVDERSDIYQVGLVLYELLSGQRTFPGGGGEGVSGNIVSGYKKRAVRLERHEKKLDAVVVGIVERALEFDPADRVQSAGAMRDEIRAYLRHKYVDHDAQQAFRKYLKDGSVPPQPLRENKFIKWLKKQVPRILWTLLVLAVVAAGIWGGKYGYMKYFQGKFTEEFEKYRVEREVWDRQPWDAAQFDTVSQKDQEIQRLRAARDYRAARNLCRSIADELRRDIESVKVISDEAKERYEEELRVFKMQKWPDGLRRAVESTDSSLVNLPEIYVQARKAYEDQTRFLYFHDSAKADTFRVLIDQKEAARKSYEDLYPGDCRGDSARAFASVIARIRQDGDLRRYQDGIEALAGIRIPQPTWRPCVGPCAAERESLRQARVKLQEFTDRPDWREHQQSRDFAQCNIAAVRNWLNDAAELLRIGQCEGVLINTSSATQCLDQLDKEPPLPLTPGPDSSDTVVVATLSPDSAYARGETSYKAGDWEDAIAYLRKVPDTHRMYREACLMMAHSRCAQKNPQFDEVTLALYGEAGPLVYRHKALTFTNMLQCFRKLRWCDSVDVYFEKAIGTGELSCNNEDVRYANSLLCKMRCDLDRHRRAKAANNDDEKFQWGSSVVQLGTKFSECFKGPIWRSQADEVREILDEVRHE
jgi:serine/threonine protein kinase